MMNPSLDERKVLRIKKKKEHTPSLRGGMPFHNPSGRNALPGGAGATRRPMPMGNRPEGMGAARRAGMPDVDKTPGGPLVSPMDGEPVGMNTNPSPEAGENGFYSGQKSEGGNASKKEIQKKTGELCQLLNEYGETDEELQKYVRGMVESALEKIGPESDEEGGNEDGGDFSEGPGMPMESVSFTKGQLRRIYEGFAAQDYEEEKKRRKAEKPNKVPGRSPFNAPKFR